MGNVTPERYQCHAATIISHAEDEHGEAWCIRDSGHKGGHLYAFALKSEGVEAAACIALSKLAKSLPAPAPDRAAKPEDFTHSWLMCRETGDIALSHGRMYDDPKCPTHDSTDCLGIYVPIEEARRA